MHFVQTILFNHDDNSHTLIGETFTRINVVISYKFKILTNMDMLSTEDSIYGQHTSGWAYNSIVSYNKIGGTVGGVLFSDN